MLFGNWPVGADLHCFQGNKLVSLYLSTAGGRGKRGKNRDVERWCREREGSERRREERSFVEIAFSLRNFHRIKRTQQQ